MEYCFRMRNYEHGDRVILTLCPTDLMQTVYTEIIIQFVY